MKNLYNILWTKNAENELENTIEYLEKHFTKREIKKLGLKIETITELISKNPNLFPVSENNNVYKVVILKLNTLYYRVNGNDIEILSFFSNRQNPSKIKI